MHILVVSNDASLAVALSLTAENREIVSVRSAGEVAPEGAANFNGTVIDVGTTYGGLQVVSELANAGVAAPFLLLGDVEAPMPHPGMHLLVRPFTLEQLDERLSYLTGWPEEASQVPFNGRPASRFGSALLGRFKRREEAGGDRTALEVPA